jgi:hypothetical protein
MQNCIHGANKFRMCGVEVFEFHGKYFTVNRIKTITSMEILIQTYLNIFSVKQFKIRNLGDWKWAVYQTITHLIFHQGNKNTYSWNRNSNKIVLSRSSVFRATALSKTAVLDLTGTCVLVSMLSWVSCLTSSVGYCDVNWYKSELFVFRHVSTISNWLNILFLLFYMSLLYFTYI